MNVETNKYQGRIWDYIKCINDPLYFATKCFVKTPNRIMRYSKYCKLKFTNFN